MPASDRATINTPFCRFSLQTERDGAPAGALPGCQKTADTEPVNKKNNPIIKSVFFGFLKIKFRSMVFI